MEVPPPSGRALGEREKAIATWDRLFSLWSHTVPPAESRLLAAMQEEFLSGA